MSELPTLRFAAMLGALGHESRLEVMRLLLQNHPDGMVAGQLQESLNIPPSTLSHHLDTLRQQGLIEQAREGRFLRYVAATGAMQELLGFLYAECCGGGQSVVQINLPSVATEAAGS